VFANVLNHLMANVLPAARDYEQAEIELSKAFERNPDPKSWEQESQRAKRRAAEVSLAIDGLADRAAAVLAVVPDTVRSRVVPFCEIDGVKRDGCIERICAIANAYKHSGPLNAKHPINSESDILATGAGYGIDAFGSGKFSGVEVLVNQRDGTTRKVLADVPYSIAGWFRFLAGLGVSLPPEENHVCGMLVKATTNSLP
jgi:hypothetical protein